MVWEPAEKVQKNASGEYRAMIGGAWVPVAKAQKSASGAYRIERGAQPDQPAQPAEELSLLDRGLALNREVGQGIANLGAGAVKGASQLGATILAPLDVAKDVFAGKGLTLESNRQRRADVTAGLESMGAQPESLMFKGGELGAEIAGTAGLGGLAAKGVMAGAKLSPTAAPMVARALETGGMATGAPAAKALSVDGVRNAAIRAGGGAATGAAMAGAINPEDAGVGAAIGGAIPVVGKLAGESGKLLREFAIDPMFKPSRAAINKLVEDAGGVAQAREAIDKAIAAGKTLSGESYTLGQAGKNWGLAATERARSAVRPENFQPTYQAQRDARIAAMQNLAGGADDVTRAESLDALKADRSESVNKLYTAMQDKPFMLGSEGEALMSRARPYGALTHAEKLAATQGRKFSIPVIEDSGRAQTLADIERVQAARPTYPDQVIGGMPADAPIEQSKDLLGEIRKLGGVSMKDAKDLLGEKQITKMGVQGGVFTTKGQEVGDMVRRLVDKGVMPPQALNDVDGGAQALRDAIQKAASGGGDDMAQRAAAEAYYGAPEVLPGAFKEGVTAAPQQVPYEIVDRAVKGGDLQAVKEGIDQVISKAEGPQLRAMTQLKNDYLKFMEDKSPEYIKANNIFADKSKPITQMEVAQRMLDALTGEAAKHGGESKLAAANFLQAYKNAPIAARTASGMKQPIEKIFTPENLKTVDRVAEEIARHQDLLNLGKGGGSDTVQKSARAKAKTAIGAFLNTNPKTSATVDFLSLGAKGRIDNKLDAMLRSPETARNALNDMTKAETKYMGNRLAELIANPAVRALPQALQSR